MLFPQRANQSTSEVAPISPRMAAMTKGLMVAAELDEEKAGRPQHRADEQVDDQEDLRGFLRISATGDAICGGHGRMPSETKEIDEIGDQRLVGRRHRIACAAPAA